MTAVPPPSTFSLADVWEYAVDRVPDREALICGDRRLTYAELDDRVNQIAAHLSAAGIGPGDTFGIFAPNCTEWLEVQFAGWKLRALPFNVNHRYLSNELSDLLADSRAVGLVFDRALSGVVAGIDPERLDAMRTMVAIDVPGSDGDTGPVPAGAVAYDDALEANAGAGRPDVDRSGEDQYLLYTGGTTGKPKGVLWRQEDAFFACFGGGDPMRQNPVTEPEQLADHIMEQPATYLCIAPLMHAAGQWVVTSWLWAGSRIVLVPGSLDPETVWDLVDAEAVNLFTMVGDATGKPLIDAWEANPGRWSAASVFSFSNGGAPISPVLKARFVATFPDVMFMDGFGSSETGAQGAHRITTGTHGEDSTAEGSQSSKVAHFAPYGDATAVLDENFERIEAGSGNVGRLALRGRIPIGYLHDPERTAATFVEHAGDRWVFTGDFATVEADGTVSLLGRGSQCINTGGEKVYSEEVEMAIQGHPDVADVLVVGVPDERWGEAVCAIVQPRHGAEPALDELREFLRATLAGYKLPKNLTLVEQVERSPAGKADYRWARQVATG